MCCTCCSWILRVGGGEASSITSYYYKFACCLMLVHSYLMLELKLLRILASYPEGAASIRKCYYQYLQFRFYGSMWIVASFISHQSIGHHNKLPNNRSGRKRPDFLTHLVVAQMFRS